MDIKDLLTIYPQAELHSIPCTQTGYLSFATSDNYLWLPTEGLSATEQQLLQQLLRPTTLSQELDSHEWFQRLVTNQSVPPAEGNYRIIQLSFQQSARLDTLAWLNEIRGMLPALVDAFFLSPQQAILIEKQTATAFTTSDLMGLFLALDGDFDAYTQSFVGYFHSHLVDFTKIFREEEQLFTYALQLEKRQTCANLGSLALTFYTQKAVNTSYLLHSLAQEWFADHPQLAELLLTLWQQQGNMSSTAKALFMHRNTLQYKLDKFQQTSGLNLKEMDQLFLCRLLLHTLTDSN